MKISWFWVAPLCHDTAVWQTHGQTDKHINTSTIATTRLALQLYVSRVKLVGKWGLGLHVDQMTFNLNTVAFW